MAGKVFGPNSRAKREKRERQTNRQTDKGGGRGSEEPSHYFPLNPLANDLTSLLLGFTFPDNK